MPQHPASQPITLADTSWLKTPALRAVFEALGSGDGETRIVGGAVRDAIAGRPVGEVDLATTLDPETVTARAGKAGLQVVPTGIGHGTVSVIAGGHSFEVTTLRVDVDTDGRRAKVAFTADWEADARRRDFTMNALYADSEGRLFDPLGGYGDVLAGTVRFIGDADARITEDYLRILRFFRIHAHYGTGPLDGAGLAACTRQRRGLARLSGERIGHEMLRLLGAPKPMAVLEAMYDSGILTLVLGGVPYLAQACRLDGLEQALGLAPDALMRLAVLGCAIEEDADRLGARLRLSGRQQNRLAGATGYRAIAALMPEDGLKLALYRHGPQRYGDLVLMAWSHDPDTGHDDWWRMAFTLPQRWHAPQRPWRGGDIKALGIAAGPAIGKILDDAEARWIAGGYASDAATQKALLEEAASAFKARHEL